MLSFHIIQGSVTSLSSRASRATTPYRPPQVGRYPFLLAFNNHLYIFEWEWVLVREFLNQLCFFDQVDAAHLTKVKTKFEEVKKLSSRRTLSISILQVDPDSCLLPFPNYRSKPPIPRCKPPPPPPLFWLFPCSDSYNTLFRPLPSSQTPFFWLLPPCSLAQTPPLFWSLPYPFLF